MCKLMYQIGRRLLAGFVRTRWLKIVAIGVGSVSILWASAAVATDTGEDIALVAAEESVLVVKGEVDVNHHSSTDASEPSKLADTSAEESVLVVKGEVDVDHQSFTDASEPSKLADPSAEQTSLEPISQTSEQAPELADEPSKSESEFAHELAKAASAGESPYGGPAADTAAEDRQGLVAQPAKFNGIQPGTSTAQDVLEEWGDPANTISTGQEKVLVYAIEPFQSVDVLLAGDTVSAIKIELAGSLAPTRLAKQLRLDNIDPCVVRDEHGVALGEVYPERGVLFLYGPTVETALAPIGSLPAVTHIVIQPLDANAFALRAEGRLHGPYAQNIRDLKFVLSLEPTQAHAYWLLADIYLATGRADQAESSATAAYELEPANAAYQLRRAQAYRLVGRYDDAVRAVRAVLDREDISQIIKAQALHEMGRLAMLGEAAVAAKAIAFESKAIELADALAVSQDVKQRRAAKWLLVEAHLAIARDIAGHDYNNKLESVSQWVNRASGLAEDFIANDGGSLELRLLVAKEALAALASFKSTKDPSGFVTEAKQAADALVQQSNDDLWRRRIQWELGMAYVHAVRIEHLRRQSAAALRYGQLAIENLADGAETRQAVPDSEKLVGQLYFQIGAIHAVHNQDHKTAVEWYDKAEPLLTAPRPYSELLAPQRDGEQLVSMGVSYWQAGEKDKALDLTLNGTELVQQSVDVGVLPELSMAVPYGNLAAMYQQLGELGDARKYAQLAQSASSDRTDARRGTNAARPQNVARRRQANRVSTARRTNQNQPLAQPIRNSSQRHEGLLIR